MPHQSLEATQQAKCGVFMYALYIHACTYVCVRVYGEIPFMPTYVITHHLSMLSCILHQFSAFREEGKYYLQDGFLSRTGDS